MNAVEQSRENLAKMHDLLHDSLEHIRKEAEIIKGTCKNLRRQPEMLDALRGTPYEHKTDNPLYGEIFKRYDGIQRLIAVEELQELSVELARDMLGEGDREDIAEEIADAVNMLEQMIALYGLSSNAIRNRIAEKIQRTMELALKDIEK